MRGLAGLICSLMLSIGQCHAHPGRGIVMDADGNVYFADATRSVVWKIDGSGQMSAAAREVHAHWIALDDAGRILADDVRYEGGRFMRGLVRIDRRGRIEILIPHRPDPDGLDAGAFAPQGERVAIARDSRPVIEWLDPSRPPIGDPIMLDPGPTLNSLVAHAGGMIAIRGRQVLALGVDTLASTSGHTRKAIGIPSQPIGIGLQHHRDLLASTSKYPRKYIGIGLQDHQDTVARPSRYRRKPIATHPQAYRDTRFSVSR